VVAEPEVFALVVAAAERSPAVVVLAAEPAAFVPVFVVAELSPEALVLVAELEVVALVFAVVERSPAVVVLAAEPEVAFVAVFSVADVAELQASVDIAVAFVASVPVSVVGVAPDSFGHPKFLAVPNIDLFASSSSFVEVVG
jgi:hypothetical protein